MTKQACGRRIPVVLPLVEVTVAEGGAVGVAIDGVPYDTPEPLDRDILRMVVHSIAECHGPVRVHVTECDGSEFTDVVAPIAADAAPRPTDLPEPAPAVAGAGFVPDEDVDVAVVVARQKADSTGNAQLRLPPALLAGRATVVVLIGRRSGTVAVCDPA